MNIITNIDVKASLKQTAVRLCFLDIRTCGMVKAAFGLPRVWMHPARLPGSAHSANVCELGPRGRNFCAHLRYDDPPGSVAFHPWMLLTEALADIPGSLG